VPHALALSEAERVAEVSNLADRAKTDLGFERVHEASVDMHPAEAQRGKRDRIVSSRQRHVDDAECDWPVAQVLLDTEVWHVLRECEAGTKRNSQNRRSGLHLFLQNVGNAGPPWPTSQFVL